MRPGRAIVAITTIQLSAPASNRPRLVRLRARLQPYRQSQLRHAASAAEVRIELGSSKLKAQAQLPEHGIDDLKEVAPSLGFGGYQALIRAYISNGLRKHLAEREAQRANDSAVDEFSRRLVARGVPEEAVREAAAEMPTSGSMRSSKASAHE